MLIWRRALSRTFRTTWRRRGRLHMKNGVAGRCASAWWNGSVGFSSGRSEPMPRIIDYPEVLRQMQSRGFVSLYHNAGAFGFASNEDVKTYGFIAEPDPTIRP